MAPSPMFNFFKKKTDVLNHWIGFVDGFQTSPGEFYTALEKELADRKVPSMEMSRIEFPEGGLLSEKRVYLRMLRERMVFDVCAAPFGSGFFFSCRTSEIPLVLQLGRLLLVFIVLIFIFWGLTKVFGFFSGILVLLMLLALAIYAMRNAVAMGLHDLDRNLLQSPVVGNIYEVWFRKETYHRIDSRLCYLETVPSVVKKLAEDTTAAKGVKLVRQYEIAPILGDFYKPARPSVAPMDFPLPESPKP